MDLKHEINTYIEVDYNDLQDLIQKHYHKPNYGIVPYQEWNNNSDYPIEVKKQEMSKYDLEDLEQFKSDKQLHWKIYVIMNDLCNNNIIDEGNYLISVCW